MSGLTGQSKSIPLAKFLKVRRDPDGKLCRFCGKPASIFQATCGSAACVKKADAEERAQ
jgi:hypothetical protein